MEKQYPSRLFHKTPSWVENGSVFHVRIRCSTENRILLTAPDISNALLSSADFYTEHGRWYAHLFLLMPDHLHALLSFSCGKIMSQVVGEWKRYQTRQYGIEWQDNFFDHRIRNTAEYLEKAAYIRNNPLAKNLCKTPEEWRWVTNKTHWI